MRSTTKFLAVLVALPLALSLASCDKDAENAKKNSTKACGSEFSGTPSKPFPSDLQGPSDQTVYGYQSQGKTQDWFATTAGTTDTIVSVRDAVADKLKGAGYTIKGTDQEKGIEAEAEYAGPHEGSIQVQVACEGKLRIRYRVES
ncbi:MAG: hypothetical protein QOK42_11 [Frankiaceae bacterium]|jgi:hypothetical protein|nr:hypothetical protein [Frankiaceae bacterium]MDX6226269.1 hypothetical protein [Frankiales bacterium]